MVASLIKGRTVDERAAILGDAALHVLARHGVRGRSLDLELQLWQTIRGILRRQDRFASVFGPIVGERGPQEELAEVTAAVYDLALQRGFPNSFLDLELSLATALKRVAEQTRLPHLSTHRQPST